MTLHVTIRHNLGKFNLDTSFKSDGKLTALFGPSGCGKTSVINAIAGLLRPDDASIIFEGETLVDSKSGRWVPAHRRGIGYVFQDARLLPHLSVAQNLRYGQWFTPAAQRYADDTEILRMLGIGDLLDRKPRQLSGGEKQRVALGRALLQSPRLLVMDEPLASLDEGRKHEVLPFVEKLRDQTNVPIVYVSHSPAEVARLATDVVLMAKGSVVAAGAAADVLPYLGGLDDELANEAGAALKTIITAYDSQMDVTRLKSEAGELAIPGRAGAPGYKQTIYIRASDVMIATRKPAGLSALNILSGRVIELSENGSGRVTVQLQCGAAKLAAFITKQSALRLDLKNGSKVFAIVKAMSLRSPEVIEQPGDISRKSGKT